jgi:hypothetical protein
MNRNDFLRMIQNTGPSNHQMVGEVNELVNIFPYFQSAYMLLLKGLQNTADVRFENQLHLTAMHIADREVLYYLLKKESVADERPEITVKHAVSSLNDSTESQQTVIESARNSDDLINTIEKNSGESSYGDKTRDHSILISNETDNGESDATIFIIDEESGSVEKQIIYMDPGFSVPEYPDLLELDLEENNLTESGIVKQTLDLQVELKPDSSKQIQADLIEKFIIANPRIEPRRDRPDTTNEDILKPIVEEKGEFVTETLARIYIRQEYYSRAIDIYEKLSLKFPEKSSYFASQIEKVKELIKK